MAYHKACHKAYHMAYQSVIHKAYHMAYQSVIHKAYHMAYQSAKPQHSASAKQALSHSAKSLSPT